MEKNDGVNVMIRKYCSNYKVPNKIILSIYTDTCTHVYSSLHGLLQLTYSVVFTFPDNILSSSTCLIQKNLKSQI